MALIHRATLRPTKLELLAAWLPGRTWYTGPAGDVARVAAYRFDDPAGTVGIETMLVRVGDGPVHQVPLIYRGAPLPDGDDGLLGTAEHSVLGTRWVYDATRDPVYAAALASAILTGTDQAEELMQVGDRFVRREPSMTVAAVRSGSAPAPPVGAIERVVDGDPAVVVTDSIELTVVRRLDTGTQLTGAVLTGEWPGATAPVHLAAASRRGRI